MLYELYDTLDSKFMPRRCFGVGAAGVEQEFEEAIYVVGSPSDLNSYTFPQDNTDTPWTFLYDPAGNMSSFASPSELGDTFWFHDAFGQLLGTRTPGEYTWDDFYTDRGIPVGFGGQWGYYTDTNDPLTDPAGPSGMGLILLGQRCYDPCTGRFLTRDPIGYDGGINVYGYTGNNPVNNFASRSKPTVAYRPLAATSSPILLYALMQLCARHLLPSACVGPKGAPRKLP